MSEVNTPLDPAADWPSSWRKVPLWSLFERVKDVGHPNEEMLSVYRDHGVVKKDSRNDNMNKTAEDRSIYQLVDDGWLVVNRMKAWQGSVGVSFHRGIVSGHYICFRPHHDEDPRFLNWLLRSGRYIHEYARISRGVRPNQIEIDNDSLRALPIFLPELDEQRRIADFLEVEAARLSQASALRERQRALLRIRESQFVAGAYERLSKLGEIVPLRHAIRGIEQGWSPECDNRLTGPGEWGVVKAGCVNGGVFRVEEHKALPPGVLPQVRYQLHKGDLLMSRASGSLDLIGSAAVIDQEPGRLLLCDKVYRMTVDFRRVIPEFVALMLRAPQVRELIRLGVSGAGGLANNLPTSVVRSLPLPLVPLDEQGVFVREMRKYAKSVTKAIAAADQQIALLMERRQALITAAVSGRLDAEMTRKALV